MKIQWNKVFRLIYNPIWALSAFFFKWPNIIKDDKWHLKWMYYHAFCEWMDFDNPKTFSQKLQWLKLNNRNPEYTKMVDKYLAKNYVSDKIGDEFIIPTLGVWDSFDEIDFDKLPNQFVLKCTHDSGGLVICKDKSRLNIEKAKKIISYSMNRNFYLICREWPYKNVDRKIIAEKYMSDTSSAELRDYKFYCFSGVPKLCQVISDRSVDEKINFYDMDWNSIEGLIGLSPKVKKNGPIIEKPRTFEIMKEKAAILSANVPFLRVDFYEINGNCYFGELTFYPAGGFGRFYPEEWNEFTGDWIILDK